MAVDRSEQPEHDLSFEKYTTVNLRLIVALQLFADIDDSRAAVTLIFLARRYGQDLTKIFLRYAQQAVVFREDASSAEIGNLRRRDRQTERAIPQFRTSGAKKLEIYRSSSEIDGVDVGLGSAGRIRTYDHPINSRTLYH